MYQRAFLALCRRSTRADGRAAGTIRFAAGRRIAQLPAPLEVRRAKIETLAPVQIGRSMSRSVISTMNEFMYSAESWLAERSGGDLEELACGADELQTLGGDHGTDHAR
jgi:hypothetical protein